MLTPTKDRLRIDAREKVLGRPIFAADVPLPGLLHAMTTPARIARGRITAIDTAAAVAVPGVVRVFTHEDFSGIRVTPATLGGNQPGFQPMTGPDVVFRGQPVALVVAETLEAASEAARLVDVTYDAASFTATMDDPGAEPQPFETTIEAGDAAAAFATSEMTVEAEYRLAQNHHNPIEMISTTAHFEDGRLVVREGTQNSNSMRAATAGALGLDPGAVDVLSPYCGGGFGQKNVLQLQSVLVSRAAMMLGRPVKLVMPRAQLFHTASHRPASRHHIRLGASRDGRIAAVLYDTEQENARYDHFFRTGYHEATSRHYGIPAYRGRERLVRIDTSPPGHMRAPHEHPGSFALECAVDELAGGLGMDPVALRLANDAARDPVTGKPFSSRTLGQCLSRGAKLFGWDDRSAEPGSMVAGDGSLIGWGVAAGIYKGSMFPCVARLRVQANGVTRLSLSGHEMGQGFRSVAGAELMELLSIDADRLEIRCGDTSAVQQHHTAGSWGAAGAASAIRAVAEKFIAALTDLGGALSPGESVHQRLMALKRPVLEVEVEHLGTSQGPEALETLRRGGVAVVGPEYPDFVSFSWIAHFVEVRVEPSTRRIRVPRVVSVADCGRVMNRRTATSQVQGGVVWGIGAALREAAEIDPATGFVLNADLADYVVPVNADIGDITVELLDVPDPMLNASGVRGVGEVAMVGAAAAVANAVHHATGRRVRHLPIRIEDLL
ncbi:xanthine dehydrogenase family protein molybdopterin-binding subunit [Acuticoccus sediminis]|uniref:Xanthine dehydrogenase family protein molybdopterin-binding subunit n=1 Tax=Acuticoccus sediminis TaxID=2184697 RepID=A0A8B2NCR1_9HYPH|nr:xanthine dehydrogenase family protein molybdopterin-binding subunit [Acuticoccus sediminis]RAH96100.1 xanthine dehydrogenase family protein molybdopterin-binding subunit [Acuticoccus sediminis]